MGGRSRERHPSLDPVIGKAAVTDRRGHRPSDVEAVVGEAGMSDHDALTVPACKVGPFWIEPRVEVVES